MKKGLKTAIILFLSLAIIAIVSSVALVLNETKKVSDKIFEGVYVNDVHLGGKTKEEAKKILEEKFNKKFENRKIEMFYKDKNYTIDFKSLNAHYDVEKAVNEAFNYGKTGNIIEKTINRYKLKDHPHNIKLEFVADTSIVEGKVKRISKQLYVAPKDATIELVSGNFSITPEKEGMEVDVQKLIELIKSSVKPEGEIEKIEIPTKKVEAKIKADALSKISTKISTFTTSFKPSDSNRTSNIRIAAKTLTGTVVMPGDVFSMNKTLGPRTEDKGYKDAPVIVNGKLESGLAGGICQVTTTVYNAALLGNFEIVKRRPHALSVAYVAPGRDATISGDVIDFQFKNNYQNPIYIEAVMETSTLTVNIYGANEMAGQTVEIVTDIYQKVEPKIEYIKDPNLQEGKKVVEEKPKTGIKVKTYRKVYKDGKLIKTEQVGNDYYKEQKGIIRIGTKKTS